MKVKLKDFQELNNWTFEDYQNSVKQYNLNQNRIMNITQEQNMETKFELKSRDFGTALQALKLKQKVAREGWNGKGMYLVYYSPAKEHPEFADKFTIGSESKPLLPFIVMKTADNMFVPWLASQTDLLAEDWTIVN